jgi:hypothetical protein
MTEENYRKFHSLRLVYQPGFEQDTSPVQVRSSAVSANVFGTSCRYPERHSVNLGFLFLLRQLFVLVKTAVFNIRFVFQKHASPACKIDVDIPYCNAMRSAV